LLSISFSEIYKRIPGDTDILLTHTPPYQVHDLTKGGKHAGCKVLAERLQQLELGAVTSSVPDVTGTPNVSDDRYQKDLQLGSWNCRLHVFGHIHEAYGASVKTVASREFVQVNAAVASSGKPIIVDIPVKQTQDAKANC
jgi:Icc-related predicted phosphoesterase